MAIPNRLDNYKWYLVILCPYVDTNVNKTHHGSGHFSGVLWDVCGTQRKNFTLRSVLSASQISTVAQCQITQTIEAAHKGYLVGHISTCIRSTQIPVDSRKIMERLHIRTVVGPSQWLCFYSAVKLFSKYSNLCENHTSTSWTDRQTDRRHAIS